MKKTKLKIFFTNISRVITSILFINVKLPKFIEATNSSSAIFNCYSGAPSTPPEPIYSVDKVFILLVPFVLLGLLIAFVIYKIKNKNKKGDK